MKLTLPIRRRGAEPKVIGASRLHMVGIAGSGMRALAEVLAADGSHISGSDPLCDARIRSRFRIVDGDDLAAIAPEVDLVIRSAAVAEDHPQLAHALRRGIPVVTYAEMLGRLMQKRQGIAIAGTHGKTTTAAMLGQIMSKADFDPTVIHGGTSLEGEPGGRHGYGEWMVAEACEFQENFRHLHPKLAAVLSIEPDHFDCFPNERDLVSAFSRFVGQVASDGMILARQECVRTWKALREVKARCESFGLASDADWKAVDLSAELGRYAFRIEYRGQSICSVTLSTAGRHNVINALAAAAIAFHARVSGEDIKRGLEEFRGLRRRLEVVRPLTPGPAIVSDYAHHPSEVSAALAAVREMFPGRRVCCAFEPHQASRTGRLLTDFARSLQNADKLIVSDIYRAREAAARSREATGQELAQVCRAQGVPAIHLASAREILEYVSTGLASDDVLVILSAGDLGTLAYELDRRLRIDRQAG